MSEEARSTAHMDRHLDELRRSVTGAVIAPGEASYDAARRCFNALVDRRPAVIVRCLGADDIATAFEFARANALEVAVRGGGHNPAGHCVCDGGLVIDLSLMRRVEVDRDALIARAEGGATWLDFDTATQAFGLVTPGGVVGSTGVAGLTFGGGIGHLTAQHGLTCDNLVSADVVTPEGTVVRRAQMRMLNCSGGCAGVAATLVWRRGWSSGCTGSTGSSAVASRALARVSRTRFAAIATSPRAPRVTSAARRYLPWTSRSSQSWWSPPATRLGRESQ